MVLLWATNFSFQKLVFGAIGPGASLFARALLIAACAGALMRWRHGRVWPALPRGEWRALLQATLTGPVGQLVIVTWGIHWSTAFSSALILACGPVFTLILLRLWRGEAVSAARWAGVALALAGILIFMSDKLVQDWSAGLGDLALLVAALLFSIYSLQLGPLIHRHGNVPVMCWTTLLASPLVALATLPAAWATNWAAVTPGVWGALFYTIVPSAFLGWMLWGWINAVLGPARCAPLMYLIPPVAGVVAWLTVGESFGVVKLAGAAVAMAGVAWSQFAPSQVLGKGGADPASGGRNGSQGLPPN